MALLWSLRRLKRDNDFIVSLETLDDVTFESAGGTPEELLQTKHHRQHEGALTDTSPDLWKTIRIWLEAQAAGTLPPDTTLHLLTTGTAPAGSIASCLRYEGRNVDAALRGLEATARSSTSEVNAASYSVFLQASVPQRRAVLEQMVVLDAQPTITDLNSDLTAEVFWAVDRRYHEPFLDRLEGWWVRRALRQLASASASDRILAAELDAQMSDLREQFQHDALPVDDDLLRLFDLDAATHSAYAEFPFVRQLEIIAAGKKRIAAAVRDYYRAFEQRSRWLRDELLLVGDLSQYETRLIAEWELVFDQVKDELGSAVAEEEKRKAAREVLRWAESAFIPIRPRVTEPFITRGSLHMLADSLHIAWHPDFPNLDFRDRLESVLRTTGQIR